MDDVKDNKRNVARASLSEIKIQLETFRDCTTPSDKHERSERLLS